MGSSLRKRGSVPLRTVSGRTFARFGVTIGRRRGLEGLIGHGLLDVRKHYKAAPLSPVGYAADHLYTLQRAFGPIPHRCTNTTSSACREQGSSLTSAAWADQHQGMRKPRLPS